MLWAYSVHICGHGHWLKTSTSKYCSVNDNKLKQTDIKYGALVNTKQEFLVISSTVANDGQVLAIILSWKINSQA